jgi:hypothetical protein
MVALRFFTRAKLLRAVGKDDWCIAGALVSADYPARSQAWPNQAFWQIFSIGNTVGMCIRKYLSCLLRVFARLC